MLYVSIFNVLALLRYGARYLAGSANAPYIILFGALFLFSAFRFEVGCDWSGYYYQWINQKWSDPNSVLDKREPLWWALIAGLQGLGLSYPSLNVASSAIFFLGVHVLARRQPDPLGFLILLFPILIVNMPMSGIRQGAAIGVMCIAFVAFNDRKLIWFVALTVLGSSLHSSAMVFLLLAPMVWGGFTKTNLVASAILAIPGAFLLLSTEDAELASSRYINTGIDSAGAIFRVGLLAVSGLTFFLFFSNRWKRWFPDDYKLAGIGSILMMAMLVLVPASSVIGDRFGYYLIPIQAMIFARIPFLPLGRQTPYFSATPYLALAGVFAVWSLNSYHFQLCYVPYQTWLFGLPESRFVTFRH